MGMNEITLDYAGCTNTGNKRPRNQDHFLIAELFKSAKVRSSSFSSDQDGSLTSDIKGLLLMVADGFGPGIAGEKASSLALRTVLTYVNNTIDSFYTFDENSETELSEKLFTSVRDSHDNIKKISAISKEYSGMMTTLTLVYVIWPHAFVVQIGDSRCYLIRKNEIQQLTKDQTYVQTLVDAGVLTEEEASNSSHNHMITQALGSDDLPNPIIKRWHLEEDDILILCTDGLTEHVNKEEILKSSKFTSAYEMCESLERSALAKGGVDNVTIVGCKFNR